MNRNQTYIVLLAGITIFLFALFPPYQEAVMNSTAGGFFHFKYLGFSSLISPPEVEGARTVAKVDYGRLFIQVGGVCALAVGMYSFLGRT